MIHWTEIRYVDDALNDYTRPIFDRAKPYAVVRASFENRDHWHVTSADSIEHASVIADAVMRERDGDCGIRIYLRSGPWMCQVHYVGNSPWPTHEEALDRVAWNCLREVHGKQGTPIRYGTDYTNDSARQRQLRAIAIVEAARGTTP